MSDFAHSEILFSGDDGLPLEFNVQYAKDKAVLKPLIEHGGGLCTLSDDAIYIVSPGTKVLNVNPSKNLITTSFIYDCVKQNYLLDTDEYRLVINEMETSDISDTSQNLIVDQNEQKSEDDDVVNDSVDIIGCNKTILPTTLTCLNSNHDFDFLDSENPNHFTNNIENIQNNNLDSENPNHFTNNNIENIQNNNLATSFQPDEICEIPDVNMIEKENNEAVINPVSDKNNTITSFQPDDICEIPDVNMIEKENNEAVINPVSDKNNTLTSFQPEEICEIPDVNMIQNEINEAVINAVPDSLESIPSSVNSRENKTLEVCNAVSNQILNFKNQGNMKFNNHITSADVVIVSSSQPNEDVLDQFDNMVLKKAQENPAQKDDECLSQSYTVSSSADAQISPKAPVHNISAEIFDGSPSAPDSASQTSERQQYINDLEKEVEQILLKPSPKSIQDKIALVKYICTAKQLPLAVVLQTLQKF